MYCIVLNILMDTSEQSAYISRNISLHLKLDSISTDSHHSFHTNIITFNKEKDQLLYIYIQVYAELIEEEKSSQFTFQLVSSSLIEI